MLFAILIGIIGALNYLLKSWIVKLRFILSGGKKVEGDTEKLPFIIFSDDKRYWNVFEPVCRELNRRGMDVVYMTASADDPAINNPYEHIKGQFIGDGNKAFAKLELPQGGHGALDDAWAGRLPVEALEGRWILCPHAPRRERGRDVSHVRHRLL